MKAKDWTQTAAGWTQEQIGTSPYDVGPYGRGLYGRYKIRSSSVWKADVPCAPVPQGFSAQKARKHG